MGMLMCFSTRVSNSHAFSLLLRKLPSLAEHIRRIADTVQGYRHHLLTLGSALMIALATHTLSIGATLLIARVTNPGASLWQASLLIPLGFLVNTVPLSPGGLGVGEAAFNALFTLVGLNGGADALLGWRLLTIVLSLPGLPVYLQGRGRFVTSAKKFETFAIAQSEPE
jgi:glycosyltransferase 2 family protein